jgi:hypothetical protein
MRIFDISTEVQYSRAVPEKRKISRTNLWGVTKVTRFVDCGRSARSPSAVASSALDEYKPSTSPGVASSPMKIYASLPSNGSTSGPNYRFIRERSQKPGIDYTSVRYFERVHRKASRNGISPVPGTVTTINAPLLIPHVRRHGKET